jgi:hypothetical protein
MVQELSYNVISHVIESWEQLRRMKNYEEVAGAVLFQRCVLLSSPGDELLWSLLILNVHKRSHDPLLLLPVQSLRKVSTGQGPVWIPDRYRSQLA